MSNVKKDKEVVVKIPAHLLEADGLVLQKVAGKYKIKGAFAGGVCEDPPQCQRCSCDCSSGPIPVNATETLRHDMLAINKKVEELAKNMDARHGELKKMLAEIKKPK